jgi:hypothetical protein
MGNNPDKDCVETFSELKGISSLLRTIYHTIPHKDNGGSHSIVESSTMRNTSVLKLILGIYKIIILGT